MKNLGKGRTKQRRREEGELYRHTAAQLVPRYAVRSSLTVRTMTAMTHHFLEQLLPLAQSKPHVCNTLDLPSVLPVYLRVPRTVTYKAKRGENQVQLVARVYSTAVHQQHLPIGCTISSIQRPRDGGGVEGTFIVG